MWCTTHGAAGGSHRAHQRPHDVVDYMFSIRLQQSAPAMYRGVPLRTGAQFVAWVLDRTVLPLVREGSGYACADIHADVCAPLAKKGTAAERQRDAGVARAPLAAS